MDVAAITVVSLKNTLLVLSPGEIKINDYQLFSNLSSLLYCRGMCLFIIDGLNAILFQFNSLTTDGIESMWMKICNLNFSVCFL